MQNDKADAEFAFALLVIRWSAAAFLLIWALDIFLGSVAALKTFFKLYVPLDSAMVVGLIGVLQPVLLLVFAVGTFRTWTYGAVLFSCTPARRWRAVPNTWSHGTGPTFYFGLPF
jgi:hypothetical protein